jgi:hypothetical protein
MKYSSFIAGILLQRRGESAGQGTAPDEQVPRSGNYDGLQAERIGPEATACFTLRNARGIRSNTLARAT